MTKNEALKLLVVLTAAYPRQEIGDPTAALYVKFMADLDYHATEVAIARHIATEKFFPAIAEIREAVVNVTNPLPSAAEAWRETLRAVYDVGIYKGPPKFSHPAVDKAVDTIGWREICMSEVGDPAIRAHFMQVYESYRQRHLDEMRYPQLPSGLRLELPGNGAP